jgi:hypothetical protein
VLRAVVAVVASEGGGGAWFGGDCLVRGDWRSELSQASSDGDRLGLPG